MALFEYDVLMSKIKDGVETIVYPFTKAKNVLGLSDEIASKVSNKNYIIDGGFQVWTDGTEISPISGSYGATMWRNFGFNNTYKQSFDTDFGNTMQVVTNADNQTVRFYQTIEDNILNDLNGKTVTLSFWAKKLTDGAEIYLGGTPGYTAMVFENTNVWQKFSKTFVLAKSDDTTSLYRNSIMFSTISASPWNTGDGVEIAQVKLEIGAVATEFEPETYAEALNSVEYYYRQFPRSYYRCGTAATSYIGFYFQYDKMRTAPTCNITEIADTTMNLISSVQGATFDGFTPEIVSTSTISCSFKMNKANHGLTDAVLVNNYTGYISLDARVYN